MGAHRPSSWVPSGEAWRTEGITLCSHLDLPAAPVTWLNLGRAGPGPPRRPLKTGALHHVDRTESRGSLLPTATFPSGKRERQKRVARNTWNAARPRFWPWLGTLSGVPPLIPRETPRTPAPSLSPALEKDLVLPGRGNLHRLCSLGGGRRSHPSPQAATADQDA